MDLQTEETNSDENTEHDFWDDLPDYVKDGVIKSLQQASEGRLTPHDEVMEKYQKYLKA